MPIMRQEADFGRVLIGQLTSKTRRIWRKLAIETFAADERSRKWTKRWRKLIINPKSDLIFTPVHFISASGYFPLSLRLKFKIIQKTYRLSRPSTTCTHLRGRHTAENGGGQGNPKLDDGNNEQNNCNGQIWTMPGSTEASAVFTVVKKA